MSIGTAVKQFGDLNRHRASHDLIALAELLLTFNDDLYTPMPVGTEVCDRFEHILFRY